MLKFRTVSFIGALSFTLLPSSAISVILSCHFPFQESEQATYDERTFSVDTKGWRVTKEAYYETYGSQMIIYRHSGSAVLTSRSGMLVRGTCTPVGKKKF